MDIRIIRSARFFAQIPVPHAFVSHLLLGAAVVLSLIAGPVTLAVAAPLPFQDTQELIAGAEPEPWQLDVPAAGVLLLEVAPLSDGARPRIERVAMETEARSPQAPRFVASTPVLRIVVLDGPGRVTLATRAVEGERYALRVHFSAGRALSVLPAAADNPGQLHLSTAPQAPCGMAAAIAADTLPVDDPNLAVTPPPSNPPEGDPLDRDTDVLTLVAGPRPCAQIGTTAGQRSHAGSLLLVTEPGVLTVGALALRLEPGDLELAGSAAPGRFYPLCSGPRDDHAGTSACATRLELGRDLSGELQETAGTDLDVFTFTLYRAQSVALWTEGEADTYGRLLDAAGTLLAADDDGGEAGGLYLARRLPPGRYYLQVSGSGSGSSGSRGGRYLLRSLAAAD